MTIKLINRSPAEVRDRLIQYGRALAERCGLLPVATLLGGSPVAPQTPWPAVDHGVISASLGQEVSSALLAAAEKIVFGRFDLLGLTSQSYGTPINWQRDPLTGREAPAVHWSRVPYLDYERVGDHKITWELNRHQWLITLGQAWVLTGDARYAATAARLLREWLDSNAPKNGINWCSALELAFRVQSWIHGLRLLRGAPEITMELQRDLVSSAAMQVDHISRNLSTWFSPNTHLTGEALAMLSAGCAWPELPRAAEWRTRGWEILCGELPKQVRPDGVYFEQSAWYQAYTLDFYTLGLTWAAFAGLPVPPGMPECVRAAGSALRAVTRPDGTIARLGDDDGGRTLPLVPLAFGDMTDSLWRAAHVLEAPELVPPTSAGRSTLLWLEGSAAFDRMAGMAPASRARNSGALRDGGWVTLAERGDDAGADHWLVLDAGPHGALSSAHSHADALSLDLSVHGVPMLIDPGTGAYMGPNRRRYRSTAAHNTVTVDGADSSEQGTAFNWRTVAESRLVGFGATRGARVVTAAHDGYSRLADPVRHRRTILRIDRHYWLMLDTLDAAAPHQIAITMQAADDVQVTANGRSGGFALRRDAVTLQLAFDPRLSAGIEEREVSPAYALERRADALVASGSITGSSVFCTVFGAEDESGPLTMRHDAADACWSITHARGSDRVYAPAGVSRTVGPARFDGDVLVALGAEEGQTIVAAGAGTLHLADHVIELGADDLCIMRRAADGTWTTES